MSSYGLDLAAELAAMPVGSASAAVIGPDGIIDMHDTGRRYPWASVTKVAAALTILDATIEGVVSLDDPAGPPGSTLGMLLCHAAGYNFDSYKTVAKPGKQRVYSNTNTVVAAEHLAKATGRSFGAEMIMRVLDLLDMGSATLDGPPSHGLVGTIQDMAFMAADLLEPRLLLPTVVQLASTPAMPELDGVLPGFGRQKPNLWGYGCEIRGNKSPHWTAPGNSPVTFGHFGMAGSFLWVDPVAELACVFVCDRDFGPWAAEAWPPFSQKVLDAYAL